MAILVYALISDVLDGYLARRWSVVSDTGYFLDGMGDKCFTVALCLVISREFPEVLVLCWALIAREVLLYALRVIDRESTHTNRRLRLISLAQAGVIRVFFLAFVVLIGAKLYGLQWPDFELPLLLGSGGVAAILGWLGLALLASLVFKRTVDKP